VHDAFEVVLGAYVATLDGETAAAVERRSRAIRRERYGETLGSGYAGDGNSARSRLHRPTRL
jgi:hypothetical protein